jgi:hypothetical protein
MQDCNQKKKTKNLGTFHNLVHNKALASFFLKNIALFVLCYTTKNTGFVYSSKSTSVLYTKGSRLALAMVVFLDIGYVRIRNRFVELVTKKVRDLAKVCKVASSSTMAFNFVVEKRFSLHKFDVCEVERLGFCHIFQCSKRQAVDHQLGHKLKTKSRLIPKGTTLAYLG